MSAHERIFHHEHAHKLDAPERRRWLPPDEVVRSLALRPGMTVADIGAGTGYFTLPIARAVAPGGQVYAVDLQREMLDKLRQALEEGPSAGLDIDLIEAEATLTPLPNSSLDMVFTANVWHELDDPKAALSEFTRLLRPARAHRPRAHGSHRGRRPSLGRMARAVAGYLDAHPQGPRHHPNDHREDGPLAGS